MQVPLWWGEWRYGAVQQVPGVCHVATVFYHLCNVPFLPRRSYLIIDSRAVAADALDAGRAEHVKLLTSVGGEHTNTDAGFVGMRLPLSLTSVLMAGVRGVLFGGGVGAAVLAVGGLAALGAAGQFAEMWRVAAFGAAAVGCGVLYKFSQVATRAGPDRRAELLALLGLPEYTDAGSYADGGTR